MPIRPEFRQFYGRVWREEVRPRILKRAVDKCEQCGKKNHTRIWRFTVPGDQIWAPRRFGPLTSCLFGLIRPPRNRAILIDWSHAWRIRVVLTIAHLNHTPGDDRDENLKALCQWCHLHYDQEHHHETRATRKDANRPLLGEMNARIPS